MRSKRLVALLALALWIPAMAMAQEAFEGYVTAGETITVTAPFGGTVTGVSLVAGEVVAVGDEVATVQTTRVQAPVDGTVRGIFAQAGDELEKTTVLYIAPVSKYTLACSIQKAYPSNDNTYVHLGETVYIKCTKDGTHKAEGIITAVNGSNFTVQTTAGELYMEETVYLYRSDAYTYATRIGKGTVGRTAEIAVTATGSLLSLTVADGDTVERGQLLFETVDGTLGGQSELSANVTSTAAGVVAEVKAAAGQKVSAGDVLLSVYPQGSYIIAFTIDEDLLGDVKVGQAVQISFHWNEELGVTTQGTVTGISYVSAESDSATQSGGGTTATTSSTQYTGYASFQADETVRLGMSVTVTTTDE